MGKLYKIHPGIGFARVGPSKAGYFLAPEGIDAQPIELSPQGEIAFAGYKDAAHLIRRQGVRFRVFEYEKNEGSGVETLLREITADEGEIKWTVKLAARKAAGMQMRSDEFDDDGLEIVTPGTVYRNPPPLGSTRDDLAASIDLSATGRSYSAADPPMTKILGKPIYIGEAMTDHAGRLVVLGGEGKSETWLSNPTPELVDFLNNPGWYDDIADGPVDADITLNGSASTTRAVGSWVIVAPPDFAPGIAPVTSLHDIVLQAINTPLPTKVSYVQDIQPLLQRAAGLSWVNQATPAWQEIQTALANQSALLADPSQANAQLRNSVRSKLLAGVAKLKSFRITRRQDKLLQLWSNGTFISGTEPGRPVPNAAQLLDQASLSRAVGGGFFPGIEAGLLLRNGKIYSELGRLRRGDFVDESTGATMRLGPGSMTERMACPWQADFVQCSYNWWPAQRPDIVKYSATGAPQTPSLHWHRGIVGAGGEASHASRKNMVAKFAQLGVILQIAVDGRDVYAEVGRDGALDTGT